MKTYIKTSLLLFPLILSFSSCNETTAKEEVQAVKPKVINIEGDTVIRLDDGEAVIVTQNKKDGRMFAIGNIDGVLSATQLEKGGATPVGVELLSADKAKIWITREKMVHYVDEDGDGLVDLKMDSKGKYRVKNIEWEKVEPKK